MTFHRRRKHVNLAGVSVAIGDGLGLHHRSSTTQVQTDGALDIESVIGAEHPRFAHDFQRSAVFGTDRDDDGAQGSAGKLQSQDGSGFYFSRIGVRHAARRHSRDFVV